MSKWIFFVTLATLAVDASGQAPGVPVYQEGRDGRNESGLEVAITQVRASGRAVKLETVRRQLGRSSCRLDLPPPTTTRLTPREIWERARRSQIRLGWSYQCDKCDEWHLKLAGGYLLTANGAAATSYHVVQPTHDMRDGWVVAADDDGKVFPVAEVLAADRYSDTCIVRLVGQGFKPLPLNTNVYPGDAVYCLSDPLRRHGYFSAGIVNRFFRLPERRRANEPGAPLFAPTRINMSTDWAPGSSGSAVLDESGNAIGHVSTITTFRAEDSANSEAARGTTPAAIVFHEATSARDVLALIKPIK